MKRKNKTEKNEKTKNDKPKITWKQRFVLIGVGFVILGFIELAVRISGLAPPLRPRDPLMEGGTGEKSYELVKDDDGTQKYVCKWKSPEFEYNYQPIPVVKDDNEIRIFVFGGSSAVGYPYDGRLAFSHFLEVGFNEVVPNKKIRVFNVAQNAIPAGTSLKIMNEVAQYDPDIFIVYAGNNEYSDEHVYRQIRRRAGVVRLIQSSARNLALYRAMEKLALPARMRVYADYVMSEEGVQAAAYTPEERRIIMDNYAYVIHGMTDFAREHDIGLVICTVAANSADWVPYRSAFNPDTPEEARRRWLGLFAKAIESYAENNNRKTLDIIDEIMEIDNARADAHYLRGSVQREMELLEEAADSFHQALNLDNVCYRASPSHNEIVIETARRTSTPLAHTESALKEVAPHGLLGLNFFWDHCHPKPEAHRVMALEIALAIVKDGLLPEPEDRWERRFDRAVAAWMNSVELDPTFEAMAYRNTAPGWMALWTDHRAGDQILRMQGRYLNGAFELLQKAIELDPELPGSYFYRGVIYAQWGEMEKARADWERELALESDAGPVRQVVEGLLDGRIPPDRGFQSWLFIRNEMMQEIF